MAILLGSTALTGCASGIAAKGPENALRMAALAPEQAAPPAAPVAASAAAPPLSSYLAVVDKESFAASVVPMRTAKPESARRHPALLTKRYNLSKRAAPNGDKRATTSLESIPADGLFPRRLFSLPRHPEGGMRQTGFALARSDLDFDLPNHLVADFSPLIYLTPRSDLGDAVLSLQLERFYRPQMSEGMAPADGRIKGLPRIGFTGDPRYLKDGRLLSMEDTVALFTQAVGLKLSTQNKGHLATFLKSL